MVLNKRYCVEYIDGTIECFREGFWYSSTGLIVKWAILAGFFLFFTIWFFGGYLHAKHRLRKGKPLLAYHRWLVSYQDRKKYGQTPQNQFSFYAHQNPYAPQQQQLNQQLAQQQQRADGTWPEPPPMYTPGKNEGSAQSQQPPVEMPMYGSPPPPGPYPPPPPMGAADVEAQNGQAGQALPPRPQKAAVKNFLGRFGRR